MSEYQYEVRLVGFPPKREAELKAAIETLAMRESGYRPGDVNIVPVGGLLGEPRIEIETLHVGGLIPGAGMLTLLNELAVLELTPPGRQRVYTLCCTLAKVQPPVPDLAA